jgi:LacI family transcriptional regulator
MATLAEIAKKAGVSTMTASLVLNKQVIGSRVSSDCAARVRGIAEELGYSPNYHARSMKRGRADALAIAVDISPTKGPPDNSDNQLILPVPYFSRIIGAFEQDAREHGMLAAIVGPIGQDRAPDRAYAGISQRRFDGMVVLALSVNPDLTSFMSGSPAAPVVSVHWPGPTKIPNILSDEAAGVGLAIDHLAELGHRNLMYVGMAPRSWGYKDPRGELVAKKLTGSGLVGEVCTHVPRPADTGGYAAYQNDIELSARSVAKRLADHPRKFTAVVCYNDLTAIGVCNALMDAGLRVPHDVSVVGFDNFEGRFYRPMITSIDLQFVRSGRRASQLLLEMIASPTRREELVGHVEYIAPVLSLGASTGPMKKIAVK